MLALILLGLLALGPAPALASNVTASFSSNPVNVGQQTTATIVVTNTNSSSTTATVCESRSSTYWLSRTYPSTSNCISQSVAGGRSTTLTSYFKYTAKQGSTSLSQSTVRITFTLKMSSTTVATNAYDVVVVVPPPGGSLAVTSTSPANPTPINVGKTQTVNVQISNSSSGSWAGSLCFVPITTNPKLSSSSCKSFTSFTGYGTKSFSFVLTASGTSDGTAKGDFVLKKSTTVLARLPYSAQIHKPAPAYTIETSGGPAIVGFGTQTLEVKVTNSGDATSPSFYACLGEPSGLKVSSGSKTKYGYCQRLGTTSGLAAGRTATFQFKIARTTQPYGGQIGFSLRTSTTSTTALASSTIALAGEDFRVSLGREGEADKSPRRISWRLRIFNGNSLPASISICVRSPSGQIVSLGPLKATGKRSRRQLCFAVSAGPNSYSSVRVLRARRSGKRERITAKITNSLGQSPRPLVLVYS